MIGGGGQHQQARAWILLFVYLTLGSCGGGDEQRSAASGVVSTHEEELSRNAEADKRGETAVSAGRVVASRNLGMIVSGAGSTAVTRSLEVHEERVQVSLPHLQDVYERERQKQPNLMGSVDLYLTIEPNGNVSDLWFPKARVSDVRFLDAIAQRPLSLQPSAWLPTPHGRTASRWATIISSSHKLAFAGEIGFQTCCFALLTSDCNPEFLQVLVHHFPTLRNRMGGKEVSDLSLKFGRYQGYNALAHTDNRIIRKLRRHLVPVLLEESPGQLAAIGVHQ